MTDTDLLALLPQAQGVLMSRHGLGAHAATDLLLTYVSDFRMSLWDVCRLVVASTGVASDWDT